MSFGRLTGLRARTTDAGRRGGGPLARALSSDSVLATALCAILAASMAGGGAAVAQDRYATGTGPGGGPHVRVFDAQSGAEVLSFLAYDAGFTGGVQVALGHLDGDGIPDIVTGTGPGGGPLVRVFDGATGALIREFLAYDAGFLGGVHVAVAEMTGDGIDEIITGVGLGGGPHVRVFDGVTGAVIREFFPYDPGFLGGVQVAGGDVNGDGVSDVITGVGPGGGPHVRVFDGVTGDVIREFFPYDPGFLGGVQVAATNVNADAYDDIVTGVGAGGGPDVRVFEGNTGALLMEFFPYDPGFRGGVYVGSVDVDGDGFTDIVTGVGVGGGPHVRIFSGLTGTVIREFFPYDPAFTGGVFVAGAFGFTPGPGPGPEPTTPVVWVPDYVGQKVEVRIGDDPADTKTLRVVLAATCHPNSVAVNGGKLYVACNSPDFIQVYDAAAIKSAISGSVLTPTPEKTITNAGFSDLIGIAFDSANNLWVASSGNSIIYRFPAAGLGDPNPTPIASLIDSPGSPVAMAFDFDGSMWVTGLFGDGIVLNFTPDQFDQGNAAAPRYCISTSAPGCQKGGQPADLFKTPEGIAVMNGFIWVANNGGNTPGREIVQLAVEAGDVFIYGIIGSQAGDTGPVFCPGGVFATNSHLWVNDQGFNDPGGDCGAGSQASGVGAVMRFSLFQLVDETDPAQVARFTDITSRPGFGGIFVEGD
jgi:sugar lactone lactonase YvrE